MQDQDIELLRNAVVMADGGAFLLFIIVVAGAFLYFLPTFVVIMNEHPHKAAVIVLNLLLGWTFIGWVGALVWSLVNPNGPHARRPDGSPPR